MGWIIINAIQGSFPVGTPGNSVPKVILTVGTAFKPALGELYKKHSVCSKIRLFKIQNQKNFWGGGTAPDPSSGGEKNPSPHFTPLGARTRHSLSSFLGNDP